MATLAGNTIASTYPLLLKIDSSGIDGTLRAVEDGDGTDSALSIATDSVLVKGDGVKLYFYDADGGEHISADASGNLTIGAAVDIILAGTAVNITADTIDLSDATKDVTLNAAVDALNFDSNTLSIDASNNRVGIGTASPDYLVEIEKANGDHTSTALSITNSQAGGYGSALNFVSTRSDGSTHIVASSIRTQGNASWADVLNTDSNLYFATVVDNTLTDRMSISGTAGDVTLTTGHLVIDSDTKGLVLGADQDATIFADGAGAITFVRGTDITPATDDVEGWMKMNIGGENTTSYLQIVGGENGNASIELKADNGDDNDDAYKIIAKTDGNLTIDSYTSGSWANQLVIDASAPLIYTNDHAFMVNENSNASNSKGVTINQSGNDDEILSFKSSDVAHGVTDRTETDTYGYISKSRAAEGGVFLAGFSESDIGITLDAVSTSDDTAKSTSANGNVLVRARKKSGTGDGQVGSNANLVAIENYDTTLFLFDAEGQMHATVASTTFDAYNDAQLVRAYDISHGKGVIESKFDQFIDYNHETLAKLKLVGREKDGTPNRMVNVTGMQHLHNGAIWQQYTEMQKMKELMYDTMVEMLGKEKADKKLKDHDIKLLDNKTLLN